MPLLLVDDNKDLIELTAKQLERRGLRDIDLAISAQEAIEKVRQHNNYYDVIYTDMRMEEDDSGLEVVVLVKAERPDIPTYILTAFESQADRLQAMNKGAWGYMSKTLTSEETSQDINLADRLSKITNRIIQQKEAIAKIRQLKVYQEGWYDGERGTPASQKAIEDAETFVKTLPLEAIHSPYISLAADGEICFWWDIKTIRLDLGFYGDGSYSYYARLDDGQEFLEDTVAPYLSLRQEILEKLQK